MSANLVNWDDLSRHRVEQGDLSAAWTNLGAATGTRGVGLRRIEIDPGRRSTPAHTHGAEEEIVFVLGGSGLSWQDGETFALAPGDCVVHLPSTRAHTLIAGEDGLDALIFGTRVPVETGWLPRAHVSWLGKTWVSASEGAHPWARERAAGELTRPDPTTPRPPHIVNYRDVAEETRHRGDCIRIERDLGAAAGSHDTGLRHVVVPPETIGAPPHCHAADEEVFVVLDGEGALLLGGEEHPVRRGHVIARPPGTRRAHALRAGEAPLTYLAYGTREPGDISYYPRSDRVYLRAFGVSAKVEPVDFGADEVW
jgi:uncharacterized cupin superfamily protein